MGIVAELVDRRSSEDGVFNVGSTLEATLACKGSVSLFGFETEKE